MKEDKIIKPKELQYIWAILKELTVTIWEEVRRRGDWKKEEK